MRQEDALEVSQGISKREKDEGTINTCLDGRPACCKPRRPREQSRGKLRLVLSEESRRGLRVVPSAVLTSWSEAVRGEARDECRIKHHQTLFARQY
jgi:hypothetical protein